MEVPFGALMQVEIRDNGTGAKSMGTNEVDAAGQDAAGEWSVTLVDEPVSEALRIALEWAQSACESIRRMHENAELRREVERRLF
jgi:hypothetical protein